MPRTLHSYGPGQDRCWEPRRRRDLEVAYDGGGEGRCLPGPLTGPLPTNVGSIPPTNGRREDRGEQGERRSRPPERDDEEQGDERSRTRSAISPPATQLTLVGDGRPFRPFRSRCGESLVPSRSKPWIVPSMTYRSKKSATRLPPYSGWS